jgi:hypothetical protein
MISDLGVTLLAMSAILALWSVAVLLMIGIGAPVGRALGLSTSTRLSTLFWLGVTVTVGWLFLVHLVTPLDSIVARLPLVAAGGIGLWMLYRNGILDRLKAGLSGRTSDWLIPGAGLLAVLVLANFSLAEPGNYDSYFYHFASIRHYSEYSAIEGLVNLHHRLGFQAATLPLASFLDLWPFDGEGFRLVNGFLGAGLVFELASRLRRGLVSGRFGLGDILLAVSVPVLLYIPGAASPTVAIASPSLDTGAAILSLVAFAYFADALGERSGERVAVALVILCLAATFRQLNLVVLAFAVPILFFTLWRAGNLDIRSVGPPLLIGGFVLLSSALHSTVVSGYPFYPATFPELGLSWAHPPAEAAEVRDFITQFARGTLGGAVNTDGFLNAVVPWLSDWISELRQRGQLGRLQMLGFISLASLAGILAIRNRKLGIRRLALLLVPLVPTLVFWFVTAPLLRFGFGPIALMFSMPLALLITAGRYEFEMRGLAIFRPRTAINASAVVLLLLITALLVSAGKYGRQASLLVSADGSGHLGARAPLPIKVQSTLLSGGVEVYQPTEQTYCGFELWCTIETQYGLKLRGDSFSEGFERLEVGDIYPEDEVGSR